MAVFGGRVAEIEDWSVAAVDVFYIALFSALEQTVVAGPTLPGPCPCDQWETRFMQTCHWSVSVQDC